MTATTSTAETTAPTPTPLLLQRHIQHLRSPLHPLISITSGLPHPSFPASLLHYHLLSEAELDALAAFYHQHAPCQLSWCYPAPVAGSWRADAGVEIKRRRFGRFIGLRGCESPGVEEAMQAQRVEEQRAEWEVMRWVQIRMEEGMENERRRGLWRAKRL